VSTSAGRYGAVVRVVAGEARGRRLVAPAGRDTRPTSDRVREAVFNALGSLDAVDGAAVVDLFAGSGALGIEALSRGAAHVVFVEPDRTARRAIETNLAATGLGARAEVVPGTAQAWLAGEAARRIDLALLDPPYAFDGWPELLDALPAALAVIESDRPVAPPAPWVVVRERRYGSTFVVFASREHPPSPEPL
jgi:16S rRNA (guanine966-N2)-methyltransferase